MTDPPATDPPESGSPQSDSPQSGPPALPPQPYVPPAPYPPGYLPPIPFTAPSLPAAPVNVAGAGKRFVAALLNGLLSIVTLGIGWLIWDLIVWKDGKNPAWQILRMRAVHADTGSPVTWGHMFVRNFLCYGLMGIIPLWNLVGACFAFGAGHQALWDQMAKTYIVNDPPRS
ncbi:MAG TPA: RDD family protein [Mycobacteriales bacterium]|nr:RDD family protein [Mycobacteriales bacterium]